MNISLAENIRRLRKSRGLTQEQLAEALGVTVGAVSKWELGASVADISYLMEMADFFQVSVDALLGFELQSSALPDTLNRLKQCRQRKNYEESKAEVEKALQKFPNSFPVIYRCGELLTLHCIELQNPRLTEKALELLRRSIELFPQNTDPAITELDIYTHMAQCLLAAERTKEALELLKKHNPAGIHDAMIGMTYAATLQDAEQALPHLTRAFAKCLESLIHIMVGFSNAYCTQKQFDEAFAACRWLTDVLAASRSQELAVCSLDKTIALLEASCAFLALQTGKEEQAETYLRQAIRLARQFDAAPSYGTEGILFCESIKNTASVYDDIGETAMAGIEKYLSENDPNRGTLTTLWEKIKHEEQ